MTAPINRNGDDAVHLDSGEVAHNQERVSYRQMRRGSFDMAYTPRGRSRTRRICPPTGGGGGIRSKSCSTTERQSEHPVDLLHGRLTAWKYVLRLVALHYEEIANAEEKLARAYTRAAERIEVPLDGDEFLPLGLEAASGTGCGGIQDMLASIRQVTRLKAAAHSRRATYFRENILRELSRLKNEEVKPPMERIRRDALLTNHQLAELRACTKRRILELSQSIAFAEYAPEELARDSQNQPAGRRDPYLDHLAVRRAIHRELAEENAIQSALTNLQDRVATAESRLVGGLKSAVLSSKEGFAIGEEPVKIAMEDAVRASEQLDPQAEWRVFEERNRRNLLNPNLPPKVADDIYYSQRDHVFVRPVLKGHLERKAMFGRWLERYYVLTPSGYLHEFRSDDPGHLLEPDQSVYLPECALGAHSVPGKPENSIEIVAQKYGAGAFISRDAKYVLRAGNREEMLRWWNALVPLVGETVAPEHQLAAHSNISRAEASELQEDFSAAFSSLMQQPRQLQSVSQQSPPVSPSFPSSSSYTGVSSPITPRSPRSPTFNFKGKGRMVSDNTYFENWQRDYLGSDQDGPPPPPPQHSAPNGSTADKEYDDVSQYLDRSVVNYIIQAQP
ncbi:uncharacterized protein VTP21DRAFT_7151 [Calcarisporiella thermophila]|uniref:uncharacterized protein n=1 Tax=Calcarisporiella thermophila TaxID=911321 RepID=UPI003742C5A3